jgi:hypothetical protein
MPTPSTTPLRLQAIDRTVAVLKAIDGPSANFWYKPYDVVKRFMSFEEVGGFPTYMIFLGETQEDPEEHLDNEYLITMPLSIDGWVNLELGEPQSKLCKCITDIEKAINDDFKSTAIGSLGQIAAGWKMGRLRTDNGGFALNGFAWFEQTVNVQFVGDWGIL